MSIPLDGDWNWPAPEPTLLWKTEMTKTKSYGVKVRVRRNHEDEYIAEYATHCIPFMPFFDTWSRIRSYDCDPDTKRFRTFDTFATLDAAKNAAMDEYNKQVEIYALIANEKAAIKRRRKSKTVWRHP